MKTATVPDALELVAPVLALAATPLAVPVLCWEFPGGGEIVDGSIITDVSTGWFALFVVKNTTVVGSTGAGLWLGVTGEFGIGVFALGAGVLTLGVGEVAFGTGEFGTGADDWVFAFGTGELGTGTGDWVFAFGTGELGTGTGDCGFAGDTDEIL